MHHQQLSYLWMDYPVLIVLIMFYIYLLNIKFDSLETLYIPFTAVIIFTNIFYFPSVEQIQNTPPTLALPYPWASAGAVRVGGCPPPPPPWKITFSLNRNINYMNENHCPVNIYLDLSKAF